MNNVRPSLSFLPMEDIAAELKTNKANRNFMTKEDNANDVSHVAGVKAERIAVSAEGHDRETIKNALSLNGVSADEYVTKEDGDKFINASTELSALVSAEVKNLRDELYQLYSELAKKGFIDNKIKYEGFVDSFNKGNVLYEGYVCGLASAQIGRSKELYISNVNLKHFFEEGKTFVIKRSDTNQEEVVMSLGVNIAGKVTFEPAVDFIDSIDKVGLFKTSGDYKNGTFSFSEIRKSVSEKTERYYTQTDDTDTKYLTIKKPFTGYASVFKVPRNINSQNNIAGALSKFAIRAQAVGNPGALRCHVVDYESLMTDGKISPKFDNIEDAIKKGFVLATSAPVTYDRGNSTIENDVYFDFYGGVHKKYNNGTEAEKDFFSSNNQYNEEVGPGDNTDNLFETADGYPILKDVKYCFLIESLGATEDSYWKIRFSYFNNNDNVDDLQRRNITYIYKKIDPTGITEGEKCIQSVGDITKYDIMYTLVIRDITGEEELGKQSGVYTTRIVLPKPIDVTRARLTMKINREGLYIAKNASINNTSFTLEPETVSSHSPSDTRFRIGDTIIIANSIAKVKKVSTTQIDVEQPVNLDERITKFYTRTVYDQETNSYIKEEKIPVYRISYTPTIKAKLVNWNNYTENNGYECTDVTTNPVELDLMAVIPDQFKSDTRVSDRLIYETVFGKNEEEKNLLANEFELQLNWNSPFSAKEINDEKDSGDRDFKELIGRIHDLVLSFDKHY